MQWKKNISRILTTAHAQKRQYFYFPWKPANTRSQVMKLSDLTFIKKLKNTYIVMLMLLQNWLIKNNFHSIRNTTRAIKQETQLSLTNCATRLNVSQGHQTYGFLIVFLSFSDIWFQKMSWPWNPGQRSLKIIESGTIRYMVCMRCMVSCYCLFDFKNAVWQYLQPCWYNRPTCLTDRQTYTGRQQRPRLRIASRGKNMRI